MHIVYADCLIDTTESKIIESAQEGPLPDLPLNWQDGTQEDKQSLLHNLRSVQVIGGCSMDNSPRLHAVNIALVSAEAINWEVFLKSHLDIMNDNFQRVSDGSYAWAKRQTYIRELEELEINVPSLMVGIALRIDNEAANHYYGSVWRIGKAMSESANKDAFEKMIAAMMADDGLDDFNRLLMYYVYNNYVRYLDDNTFKLEAQERLVKAIEHLPPYIAVQLK